MTAHVTYADLARPVADRNARLYDIALVAGGSIALAISARIAFHIGPVPFTAQTFAVVLFSALLGSRRALSMMALYLAEGAAGLPVFAAGAAGLPYLLGPTGGYLLGFLAAGWAVGWLAEKGWDRSLARSLVMMFTGHGLIFAGGIAWLTVLVGLEKAIAIGLAPFIAGCILKSCLAAALLPSGWKALRRLGIGEPERN